MFFNFYKCSNVFGKVTVFFQYPKIYFVFLQKILIRFEKVLPANLNLVLAFELQPSFFVVLLSALRNRTNIKANCETPNFMLKICGAEFPNRKLAICIHSRVDNTRCALWATSEVREKIKQTTSIYIYMKILKEKNIIEEANFLRTGKLLHKLNYY